jgi:site-specific DNA recombinase
MRVAIYARYSSDQQRDASIPDQFRICRELAGRQGWTVVREFSDAAKSGASDIRPGYQNLLRDATAMRFDIVLAESLDRLSRDQEDTAHLFKQLSFRKVRIVTLAEGDVTNLIVGFKGTMNSIFLKDLADKTRRGLRGRAEAGKSAGGLSYGYRVNRTADGAAVGERSIDTNEAAVVTRIFTEFASGASPQAIAKRLNTERVPGPRGRAWGPSTIHGHAGRGTGILNNELYVGLLVWNKLTYVKDPDTGKRVSRLNPATDRVIKEVPQLRVLPDELWRAAKKRQQHVRQALGATGNIGRAQRPLHVFSGLIRCASCDSSYVVYSAHRLACSGMRDKGICSNRLTIRRDELEARVLTALQTRFFENEAFKVFCDEFTTAVNETRMQARSAAKSVTRELAKIDGEIKKLIQAIKDGVPAVAIRGELLALENRKVVLRSEQEQMHENPPLLHPSLADRWRQEVTELRQALEDDHCDPEAREAVRHMVAEIRLTPSNGVLTIDVKGNLAAMLAAASHTDDWQRQIALVAGGGFEPPTFGL